MQLLQPYGLKFAYDLFLYQMNSEAADLLFQVDSLQVGRLRVPTRTLTDRRYLDAVF